jgi:hypothetical protein
MIFRKNYWNIKFCPRAHYAIWRAAGWGLMIYIIRLPDEKTGETWETSKNNSVSATGWEGHWTRKYFHLFLAFIGSVSQTFHGQEY